MSNLTSKLQSRSKHKMWKKCWLFQATNFQSLMYPCFVFCTILGIFSYKVNGPILEISKWRYVLSTITICAFCVYELVVLYQINISKTVIFSSVPKMFERDCFLIFGGFIAIITYALNRPRMKLLQIVMKISSRLPVDAYKKLSILIHIKDIVGFLLLFMHGVSYYTTIRRDTWQKIFVPYVHLLIFQMDMLYMNCVCILKTCFKEINNNMKNLCELVVNDKPHLLRRIYHEHRNPFLLTELRALKEHHLAVSDAVQMLNKIFSLQLLASVIMTFIQLTFNLYFLIMHWKIGTLITNMDDQFYDIFLTTIITFYSIKIMLMGWACETGKDQAMKIGSTVHEVLNGTKDEQIKGELQLFSLQILHRNNVFSAKGLNVDATLLTAVVGNITTYLLILIQFVIAERFCSDKIANNGTQIT
ncbi:hypothetical protein P5V15_009551 [Pogonomyrmex californicus]